ncbi:MAG: AAA family ATPase [Acidobacteriota bacterium]
MRILAIRGCNLASLTEFEVLFDQGPLGNAGLFAITGPTGAGKSTLLDAMCLALYDCLPRIKAQGGGYKVPTGGAENEALPFTDCRHIIQRGKREAYAEVDFLGCDSKRWRARWEVSLSKGKLQKSKSKLFELPSKTLCSTHKKGETLDLIRKKVGLSYEQFCRSVLLAQGDFAAFLKSSADERANLLEAMTDTQLYTKLSKGAHERVKQEQEKLKGLENQANQIKMLAQDERDKIEDEKKQLENRCRELEREQDIYNQANRWYTTLDTLQKAYLEAKENYKAASQEQEQAANQRASLHRLEQAQCLRPLYEGYVFAEREQHEAAQAAKEASEKHQAALKALEEAQRQAEQAKTALKSREAERANRQPDINRARALDAQLQAAKRLASEAQAKVEHAEQELEQQQKRLEGLQQKKDEVDATVEQTKQWLDNNWHFQALAEQEERWERDLRTYSEIKTRLAELRNEQVKLEGDLERRREELEQLEAALRDVEKRYGEDKQALETAGQHLETLTATQSPDARREACRRLEAEREAYRALETLVKEAEKVERERIETEQAIQGAEKKKKEGQEASKQCLKQKAVLAEALRARKQELILAQATEELAARRPDLLIPGQPCPLCGSIEHPEADKPLPPSDLVARLKREVETTESSLEAITQRLTELEAQAKAEKEKMEEHRQRQTQAKQKLETYQAEWEKRRRPDLPVSPLAPEVQEQIKAILNRLDEEKHRLDAEESAYETARQQKDAAAAALEQSKEQYDQAKERYREAEKALEDLANKLQMRCKEFDLQKQQCEQLHRALAIVFSGYTEWEAPLDTNINKFLEEVKNNARTWRKTFQMYQKALSNRQTIETQLAVCQSDVAKAQANLEKMSWEACSRNNEYQRLATERSQLLDGQLTEAFCWGLDDAVNQAQQACAEALQKLSLAQQEEAKTKANDEASKSRQDEKNKAAERAYQALKQGLSETDLSEHDLKTLLDVDPEKQQELKEYIAALDKQVEQTKVLMKNKEQELNEHQKIRPAISREDLLVKLQALRDEYQSNLQAIGRLTEQLRQDEENRQQHQALMAQIEIQKKAYSQWAALDAVIGAADGKTFRNFVQNFQFQTLLDQANVYLSRLRQRYRLLAVQNANLELQVGDNVLDGAIRPVEMLSGGETFLVSLALALGLAALNANKVTIKSLFIDEGFGTLDSESLETALGMLYELQATGCQIGIISHLPELAERIGYRIAVQPSGRGTSQVTVLA